MSNDTAMYRWRRMSPEQKAEALAQRRRQRLPWHGPPHYESDAGLYLISAACYEHKPIIGASPERMAEFETKLLSVAESTCERIFAWVVLPNHYHVLVRCADIHGLLAALGRLHGGSSFRWNGEERCRGRQIWHRAAETAIKSERHFWATLNYVLNNPVRHGYVERWQDWPYSNAAQYLKDIGREEAERRWREYPVLDFGKDWDPPEM
jgi:REP-associated tyrosine transposase